MIISRSIDRPWQLRSAAEEVSCSGENSTHMQYANQVLKMVLLLAEEETILKSHKL